MQLHIITLPQRKEQIQEEINRLKIDAVYWPAIVIPENVVRSISRSHKQIVRYAKVNGLKEIAIAEDDCIFTSIKSWDYFLEHKPHDFDLYIGNHYSGAHNPDNTIHHEFTGLTIYIIAERFYDKLLSANELRNIDTALNGLGKFVVCNPEIAKQTHGYSYNRKKIVNDDHYLKGREFLSD